MKGDLDASSQVHVEDLGCLYPIYHFDVSHHRESLQNTSAEIEVSLTLGQNFEYPAGTDAPYKGFALVMSERYFCMDTMPGRMDIIV